MVRGALRYGVVGLATGDVNADGRAGVVATHYVDSELGVLLGTAFGQCEPAAE